MAGSYEEIDEVSDHPVSPLEGLAKDVEDLPVKIVDEACDFVGEIVGGFFSIFD